MPHITSKSVTRIDLKQVHNLNYIKSLAFTSGVRLLIRRRLAHLDRKKARSLDRSGMEFANSIFQSVYRISKGTVVKLKTLAVKNNLLRIEQNFHELFFVSGPDAIRLRMALKEEGQNMRMYKDGTAVEQRADIFFVL